MLTDRSDFDRLRYGFEVACDLMRAQEVRDLRNETFSAGYSRVVRRLNQPGFRNVIATNLLSKALDGPSVIRRQMLRWGIASGDIKESRLTSAPWQAKVVRSRSFGTYHPAGSCAMGSDDDAMAVVSPETSVYGVDGLSVVDASIMPTLPRGNTNIPVTMLAERAADLIMHLDG
jgi:5-(hydroxymethyl)furfural/furfural oxidase